MEINTSVDRPLVNAVALPYDVLQAEVLRAIRAKRSTREMSAALGFSFDQYGRWERGSVRLRWSSFERICAESDVDLRALFFRTYGCLLTALDEPGVHFAREFFLQIVGPLSHRELADRLSVPSDRVDVDRIDRWMYGRTEMTFPEVCHALYVFTSQGFFSWISGIVSLANLPSISTFAAQGESQRSVYFSFPYAASLEAAVQLASYRKLAKHDSAFVAEATGLSVEVVDRMLPILESVQRLRLVEGKYEVNPSIVNVQGGSREELARLTRYWTEQALHRFQTPTGLPITKRGNPNAILFRVAPVSRQATMAITEALQKCHNEISKILETDKEPAEEIRIVIGHHFSVDEKP